ncbi:MAG: beta-galactosidase, partial [Chthoniobacterales bacterium]
MKNTPTSTALKIFTVLICLFGLGVGKMSAATWKIGAAKAGPGGINKILPGEPPVRTWTVTKEADAIEGEILSGTSEGETHPIPVIIPKAGTYRVWVRHYHIDGAYTSFFVLFRNQLGQAVDFHNVDFKLRSIIATAKPILQGEVPSPTPAPTPVTAKPEFVWTSFDVTFEAPMEGTISFGPTMGQTNGKLGIDCVVISDDKSFDPAKVDKAEIAKLGADGGPLQPQTPPTGMQLAPVLTAHTSFFSPSDITQDEKFVFSLVNQMPTYRDYAWAVQMGSNSDHGWTNGNSKYGVDTEVHVDGTYIARGKMAKEIPSPTGRFVSADGKVSTAYFSLSYAPFAEAARAEMTRRLPDFIQDPDAKNIMISSESSGSFDYGPDATKAFHAWLATRFTTIDKLNTLWRTQYKSFDEIPLPLMPEENSKENKAAWFAFREFSGLKYVENIAANATLLRNHPGRKLLPTSQSSCLTINSPTFTSGGPMDFEDLINVGFANEGHFGMDAYSTADSFAGCDIDFLLSLTKGRKFVNNEFNVHSQDPRNMAQTYWAMLSKGTKGVATWQFQESPGLWMYYMWALVHSDDTPRDKLGPIADSNQEIHRLERILGPAKPAAFVKPIALYYSRMDLSLKQTTMGVYSSAFDSPYRIYAILRGLGYPVRWITPKQIEAGELKDVGAVFLVGVAHVPGGAATKLAQWVKDGGCIAGDQWPGGFNEYDYTQTALLDVFGIRPAFTGKAMDKATAQHALATTTTPVGGGIDPEVLRTLAADQLLKNVEEMWDQFDSKHPVALAAGNWHLSGFDLKKVGVISPTAEVIGMTMSDDRLPGIV